MTCNIRKHEYVHDLILQSPDIKPGDIFCDGMYHYVITAEKICNYKLVVNFEGKCPDRVTKGRAKMGEDGKQMTFDTFIVNRNPELYNAARRFSIEPDFGNLIFAGSTGTGKSHLASAIIANTVNTQYCTSTDLLSYSVDKNGYNYESKVVAKEKIECFKKCPRFILDDIGAEEEKNDSMREVLYEISDARNNGTLWITNLSSKSIDNRYGTRILSRMMKRAKLINCIGPDFRIKNINQ